MAYLESGELVLAPGDVCGYCDHSVLPDARLGEVIIYFPEEPSFAIGRFRDGKLLLAHKGQVWHGYCYNGGNDVTR